MKGLAGILALCLGLMPMAAGALALQLPGSAVQTDERAEPMTSYRLPISGWQNGHVQMLWAEGELTQQAWQFQSEGLTTMQILVPLRDQITADGFDILYECDAETCGGFDFRYAMDVLPEPAMHVDLGDYRFLSAQRMAGDLPEYICLLVSRSSTRGFVQVVHVGPASEVATPLATSTKSPAPDGPLGAHVGAQLEETGRAVLQDLTFDSGSAQLGDGPFASLEALATYLKENPDRRVSLVGHTDAEGSLDANIALSRKRALSVVERLRNSFNIPASQLQAEGIGFLSPQASNLTDDGRSQNRRVEAILTSTQ